MTSQNHVTCQEMSFLFDGHLKIFFVNFNQGITLTNFLLFDKRELDFFYKYNFIHNTLINLVPFKLQIRPIKTLSL